MNSQPRPGLVRVARYAAYGAGALAILLIAVALVVPIFLDTPAVERELKAKLSQAVQGEVAWERLSLRLLPSPRGSLSGVKAEIPGVASLGAEQVDAHLRLWPLLHGSAEIASVTLVKPVVRLRIAPPAKTEAREEAKPGPLEGYRAGVDAVRRLAPDAEVEIEQGDVELGLPDLPVVRVRALTLHGRTDSKGLTLELTATSESWSRLKVSGNVGFDDYSGTAKAEIGALKPQAWLDHFLGQSPVGVAVGELSVRAEARTDGRARLECDFDLRSPVVEIARGAEPVRVPEVAIGGKASVSGEEFAVRVASAQLGASRLREGSLRYGLKDGALAAVSEFDLDLAQSMDATRRLLPEESAKALARFQPVAGRAQGQAKFEMRSPWRVQVDIRQSDAAIGIEGLPAPVKLAGGSVSVTGDAVSVERADVSLLDARANASATIAYGKRLRIEGAVPEASIGDEALAWIWKTAGAPTNVALKTPVRIGVRRAAWGPGQPLEVDAAASVDTGPRIAVELAWTPKALDIRRATLKDANSDATVALHLEKGLAQGSFFGSLQSASIGALLKGAKVPSGIASGDLRFRADLARPGSGTAVGKLKGDSVDLTWLVGRPVVVERLDAEADGQKLVVREASVSWAGQRFALTGTLARAADGAPVVDAQIESPGVVIDALLPESKAAPPKPKAKAERKEDGPLWTQWPLPVRGRIAFRSKFVQHGERKAEPVVAALMLEPQRAVLELQQVRLCGISFPLTAEARPEGLLSFSVKLAGQKQQLDQTAHCLSDRGVEMTGEFDLSAEIRSSGKQSELLGNLEGTVEAEARGGRVRQFPLILKILSVRDVAESLKKDGVGLEEAGFPYRTINAKGRFVKGTFVIDESAFRSNSVGFAASGSISLSDKEPKPYESELIVLVAPLSGLDSLMRAIPILGNIVQGTLTSWPVRVSGDIRNPQVEALSAGAITSEFVGMFQRTLKLPVELLPKLTPPKTQ